MQHLDKAEIGKIAVQRSRRPLAGFLYRVDGKLHRDAAAVADPGLDAVRQEDVDLVAGCQVASGLGDPDDGSAGLQFGPRVFLVEVAFQVEGRHARISRVVEPFLRPEFPVAAGIAAIAAHV